MGASLTMIDRRRRAPAAPSRKKRYRDPARPGPWLCLESDRDGCEGSSAVEKCPCCLLTPRA
jgi:hypothetical protein